MPQTKSSPVADQWVFRLSAAARMYARLARGSQMHSIHRMESALDYKTKVATVED